MVEQTNRYQDHPPRLSEEEIFAIFDTVDKHGDPKQAQDAIEGKLHIRRPHRKTVTAVFNIGVQLFRRGTNTQGVLSTEEAEKIAREACYGVSRSRVVEVSRLYQIWRANKTGVKSLDENKKYLLLATQWRDQLVCPPPELVFIDSLGKIGINNSPMKMDMLRIGVENIQFGVRVTQTAHGLNSAASGTGISWELLLDGSPLLLCAVESNPSFSEMLKTLSEHAIQSFKDWKSSGGEYLKACMHTRRAIVEEAKERAGGLVTLDNILDKFAARLSLPSGPPVPSRLNPEFSDLIYFLSIKCKRTPGILNEIIRLYHTRQKGLFCDLMFGSHEEPLATGLPTEVENWIGQHQTMIKQCAQSKTIGSLLKLHQKLLTLEESIKTELNKLIGQSP